MDVLILPSSTLISLTFVRFDWCPGTGNQLGGLVGLWKERSLSCIWLVLALIWLVFTSNGTETSKGQSPTPQFLLFHSLHCFTYESLNLVVNKAIPNPTVSLCFAFLCCFVSVLLIRLWTRQSSTPQCELFSEFVLHQSTVDHVESLVGECAAPSASLRCSLFRRSCPYSLVVRLFYLFPCPVQ